MLYDLNIAWSPSTSSAELERTLRFSKTLGYDVVALNHTIVPPVPSQITNPLPRFPPPASASASTKTENANTNSTPTTGALPTVLHRATLVLSDNSAYHRLAPLATLYDVVAVRPTTEQNFTAACLGTGVSSGGVEAASPLLISLDLAQRLPFHFRPRPCMAAVKRGARFEVCYARCLPGGGSSDNNTNPNPPPDQRARAAFLGNVAELVRATRGRGIVLTSGARDALGLRAPADVVNLLAVWGLGPERGAEGLAGLPRSLLANERIRRTGFRGVVDVLHVADKGRGREEKKDGDDEDAMDVDDGGEGVVKGKAGGGGKKASKRNAGKRKVEVGGEEEGGGDGGGGGGGGPEGGQDKPLSKRQAKRMKKAALSKANPPPPAANAGTEGGETPA